MTIQNPHAWTEYATSNDSRFKASTGDFLIPVFSVVNDYSDRNFTTENERFFYTMRTIQGSLIVSSLINIIIGYSTGWGNFTRFFTHVVIVPVVCLAGLGLFARGFSQLGNCVEIGLPMLMLLVLCQQYLKCIHPMAHVFVERFSLLFYIAIVWAFAAILTVSGAYNNVQQPTKLSCHTDHSYLISSAPWIRVSYPFQWSVPVFRASHVFAMMGAALVSVAELANTEEYIEGQFTGNRGEILIRQWWLVETLELNYQLRMSLSCRC